MTDHEDERDEPYPPQDIPAALRAMCTPRLYSSEWVVLCVAATRIDELESENERLRNAASVSTSVSANNTTTFDFTTGTVTGPLLEDQP